MARQIFVNVLVSNPFHKGRHLKVKAFVDNGSTDSAMPRNLLQTLYIKPEGWERYEIWGGKTLRRRWGYARFEIQGNQGIVKVTFEPAQETPTVGAVALEELGFDIDMKNGGLKPFLRRGPTLKIRATKTLKV